MRYDGEGRANTRRSRRQSERSSNARSLEKETLRRQLRGRHALQWPRPSTVPHGDLHVYTDGSAAKWRGQWRAGCGVWFDDDSPFNISTNPRGRQTSNRAELTAVILALRRAMAWPTLYRMLTIFSDSKYVVDGVNIYLDRWETDGWTRSGAPLKNADLWKLLYKTLREYAWNGYGACVKHVPAHVGIYGNEKADRLAKAAMKRAHHNRTQTPEQRLDRLLDDMADDIVNAMLST